MHSPPIHPLVVEAAQELLSHLCYQPPQQSTVYIGGGTACYGWLGPSFRTSKDIDVDLSHLHRCFDFPDRIQLPKSEPKWEVDDRYTTALSLRHEDFDKRAVVLAKKGNVSVALLAPVDLAISKLDRFSERDRNDIASLLNSGVANRDVFDTLAKDAISSGIGVKSRLTPVRP